MTRQWESSLGLERLVVANDQEVDEDSAVREAPIAEVGLTGNDRVAKLGDEEDCLDDTGWHPLQ